MIFLSTLGKTSKFIACFFVFLLFITCYLSLVTLARAQVPQPYVPCGEVRTDEFHFLRPYQASPCNESVSDVALFCGNDLVVKDSITRSKSDAVRCEDIDQTTERCYFSTGNTTSIAINLSGATFPIAGYTEGELATEDKVNEYVSWYLNGAANIPGSGETDVVNLGGPIKKLLSWYSLAKERLATIKEAGEVRHNQEVDGTRLKSIGNIFSSVFQKVPLSSTEDRKGAVETEAVPQVTGPGVTITDVSFSNQTPADLFVPHMEEINKLATLLQQTFVSKGGEVGGSPSGIAATKACDLAQIRTNPGDNLFAGEIKGDLSYTAEFSCDFKKPEIEGITCAPSSPPGVPSAPGAGQGCPPGTSCNANGRCVGSTNNSCTKDIFVNLSVITKTPLADEVWEKLVAGPAGVFKRIFPKIGNGGALAALLDIPGATKVNYSGAGLVYAGNSGNERKGESAELYFPHLGSVSEYFLKGIQTILRPKGFGEQILSGQPSTLAEQSKAETGEADCDQKAPEVNEPGLISKSAFADLADRWLGPDNFAEECFNDVVAQAKARGVNPAYLLIVWLVESGASNASVQQQFGINDASVIGFNAQIEGALTTLGGGVLKNCAEGSSWPNRLYGYVACYVAGDPNQSGKDYIRLEQNVIDYYNTFTNTLWPAISGGCALPSGPTDNSCQ